MKSQITADALDRMNARWLELMRAGNFAAAWQISDELQGLRAGIDCSHWPRHRQFIWNGESLASKRVLVRCYHGMGDTVQFVRLLPLLENIAARVTLWVQPALIPLLSYLPGSRTLLPLHDGSPGASYDVDIELSELMHALRLTAETLPNQVPYLHVPAEPSFDAGKRVGLVWRSGDWDPRRSVPCELFAPLHQLQGVQWQLFQRGPGRAEWHHHFGYEPPMANLLEEARALRSLSLLITVDTLSAHLAGALGVPVWMLLHSAADWRWMEGRTDTPWYPTMRLFRQARAGEWRPVIAQVCEELTKQTANA